MVLFAFLAVSIKGFREEKDVLKFERKFSVIAVFISKLQRHGLPEEEMHEEALIDLAYTHDIPLVATNDAYFKCAVTCTRRTMHCFTMYCRRAVY